MISTRRTFAKNIAAATAAIIPLLPFIPLILGIIAVGWVLGKVFDLVGGIIGGIAIGIVCSGSRFSAVRRFLARPDSRTPR